MSAKRDAKMVRRDAEQLMAAADEADKSGADVALAPDETRRVATALLLAAELLEGGREPN